MAIGQLSDTGIIFQNSFGTAGDVGSIHWIPRLSSSLMLKKAPIYSENMRGIFDEGDSYEGPNTVEGAIEAEAQVVPLGAMLKSIMNITTVTSGSLYTHTFKPRTSDFDELSSNNPVTVYQYLDTGSAMMFSDLNGSVLEIGIANGELLKTKVDYVGGTFSQNAPQTATFDTGKRFTWDVASISIGGSAIAEIDNLVVKLDEGLEAQHTLNNSKYPSRIKRTAFRNVSVDGTIKFDNQDEYQKFVDQSERELIMHFTNGTEVQSGYPEAVTLKLPLMRYEAHEPTAEGPGLIEATITGRGKYSTTSATALEITVYNDQAAY